MAAISAYLHQQFVAHVRKRLSPIELDHCPAAVQGDVVLLEQLFTEYQNQIRELRLVMREYKLL